MKEALKWYLSSPFSYTIVYVNRFSVDSQLKLNLSEEIKVSLLKEKDIDNLISCHDKFHLHWFSLKDVLDRMKSKHSCYIAKVNNAIVGFMWIGVNRVYSTDLRCDFLIDDDGIVSYNGFVKPEYRGMNIHPAMKNMAYEELRQQGKKWAYSYIHSKNVAIIKSSQKFKAQRIGKIIYGYFLGCYYLKPFIPSSYGFRLSFTEDPFHRWKSMLGLPKR